MWDVDSLQLLTIACSSSCATPSSKERSIVHINDMKTLNGCVYVATNNGHILVFDGKTGAKVNEIRGYTLEAQKIIPLDPIIAPPRTNIMQHYQNLFLKKDPRIVTFGLGHLSLMESKFGHATSYSRDEKETRSVSADDSKSNKQKVMVKLWNTYGDSEVAKMVPVPMPSRRPGQSTGTCCFQKFSSEP